MPTPTRCCITDGVFSLDGHGTLRYCARPAFASERLSWDGSDQPVRYSLTKPLPTGQTEVILTPLVLCGLYWTARELAGRRLEN
jgi:hypothetical protein